MPDGRAGSASIKQGGAPSSSHFGAMLSGAPSLQMGGGAAPPTPPALLSREETNKQVLSNTQEGESQTKTLQGVKSEENK